MEFKQNKKTYPPVFAKGRTKCHGQSISFRGLQPAKCQVVLRRFAGTGVLRCLCHLHTLQRSKSIFFWFLDYVDSIFQSSQKSRCPDHKHRWGFSTVVDASGTVPVLEVERLQCLGFIPVILHESFSGFSLACLCFYFYSPNSWNSFKDSYFKYRGEGLQIFWICFGGVFDAALLHKVDLVMLSMQRMKFTACA